MALASSPVAATITASTTLLEGLVAALTAAAAYNKNDQVPPAAVLWPDKERQWEALTPRLAGRLPLLTLGPYEPATRHGPAIWIRAMLARSVAADSLAPGDVLVIYLPGVAREEVRAVESCPRFLQPLAELQYRGVLWNQRNNRDWTIAAFLQSHDGGLGIDVSGDGATREALVRALPKLADEPLTHLRRQAPIRAAFLDGLLQPDEPRSLLRWLNDPGAFRAGCSVPEWAAFAGRCEAAYGFHPEKESPVGATRRLAERKGAGKIVWERFCEAPHAYPQLPEVLRRAKPARPAALFLSDLEEVWPQDTERAEDLLRDALTQLGGLAPDAARNQIALLAAEHAPRAAWVWRQLGLDPLAQALEALTDLAQQTRLPLDGIDTQAMARAYAETGWRADAAAVRAIAAVKPGPDLDATQVALGAVYRPWLDTVSTAFQSAATIPGGYHTGTPMTAHNGTVLLFSDGLRMDVAQRVAAAARLRGLSTELAWRLTALPSVTGTAKPAVSPVAGHFGSGDGITPKDTTHGTDVSVEVLRRALAWDGIQVLRGDELGDPAAGSAWTEGGDIDDYGHGYGVKLATYLVGEVEALTTRVGELLAHGWQRVILVTDHGWLLLPGGLPKRDLSVNLTEVRKGRCARLKPGALTSDPCAPWHWNPEVIFAYAPGVHAYEAGREYEHGGLSPQECVVPVLTIMRDEATRATCTIKEVRWRGLVCAVRTEGDPTGIRADLRTHAADPATSVVQGSAKLLRADGTASLAIPDDDREGSAAHLILLDESGVVLAQQLVTVGG